MLFNSFEFLLLFLPITLLGFYVLARFGNLKVVLVWLILCSLFFHGYWKASYTGLFVVSIVVNYCFGRICQPSRFGDRTRKIAVILGVAFNLLLLGYFKYAGFFALAFWQLSGKYIEIGDIVLPLAISFYTFQQIAYLVDTYRGQCARYTFLQYMSYLAFFPHLIAGPIVRHDNLIMQLSRRQLLTPKAENLLSGIAIILIGLFKKVVLADTAASYVDPIFFAAGNGVPIGFTEAWVAVLLFSFVIYFDFSGYSDMAIGLARLFNIRFPENFASPYKAANMIEFWRRWHITLSNFLRDYLYIPLGGNRNGRFRQYLNLMLTMLLGGLWHGAAWNFVIWGGLHGVYLAIAHTWQRRRQRLGLKDNSLSGRITARAITFVAVVVAWVFFRSSTLDQAGLILAGMVGLNGLGLRVEMPPGLLANPIWDAVGLSIVLLVIVNVLPNTQQFMRLYRPVLRSAFRRTENYLREWVWRPSFQYVCFVAALGLFAVSQLEYRQSFIYFRF